MAICGLRYLRQGQRPRGSPLFVGECPAIAVVCHAHQYLFRRHLHDCIVQHLPHLVYRRHRHGLPVGITPLVRHNYYLIRDASNSPIVVGGIKQPGLLLAYLGRKGNRKAVAYSAQRRRKVQQKLRIKSPVLLSYILEIYIQAEIIAAIQIFHHILYKLCFNLLVGYHRMGYVPAEAAALTLVSEGKHGRDAVHVAFAYKRRIVKLRNGAVNAGLRGKHREIGEILQGAQQRYIRYSGEGVSVNHNAAFPYALPGYHEGKAYRQLIRVAELVRGHQRRNRHAVFLGDVKQRISRLYGIDVHNKKASLYRSYLYKPMRKAFS